MDVVDLLLSEKILFIFEHGLEEVLGDAALFGQVKLYCKGVRICFRIVNEEYELLKK